MGQALTCLAVDRRGDRRRNIQRPSQMSGELILLREDLVDFSERNGVCEGVESARRGDAARGADERAPRDSG